MCHLCLPWLILNFKKKRTLPRFEIADHCTRAPVFAVIANFSRRYWWLQTNRYLWIMIFSARRMLFLRNAVKKAKVTYPAKPLRFLERKKSAAIVSHNTSCCFCQRRLSSWGGRHCLSSSNAYQHHRPEKSKRTIECIHHVGGTAEENGALSKTGLNTLVQCISFKIMSPSRMESPWKERYFTNHFVIILCISSIDKGLKKWGLRIYFKDK